MPRHTYTTHSKAACLPEPAVIIQAAAVEVNVCEDALKWIHVGRYQFS